MWQTVPSTFPFLKGRHPRSIASKHTTAWTARAHKLHTRSGLTKLHTDTVRRSIMKVGQDGLLGLVLDSTQLVQKLAGAPSYELCPGNFIIPCSMQISSKSIAVLACLFTVVLSFTTCATEEDDYIGEPSIPATSFPALSLSHVPKIP